MMIIGPDEIAKLQLLKVYAERNKFTHAQLELIRSGKATPIGSRTEYRCNIPPWHAIVFTINETPGEGSGWVRHLSITWLSRPLGIIPDQEQIQEVMDIIGFADTFRDQKFVKVDQGQVLPGFPILVDSINIQEFI